MSPWIASAGAAGTALLLALLAALIVGLGYRAGTHTAIRWHGRRIARDAQHYLRPELRTGYDIFHQPRKEEL